MRKSGFVRLSLNRSVVGTEMSGADVLKMVRRFSDLPGHVFLADTARLAYAQFNIDRLATAGQATEFHMLAVARATRSVLVTMDKAIPDYLDKSDRHLAELLLWCDVHNLRIIGPSSLQAIRCNAFVSEGGLETVPRPFWRVQHQF